MAKDAAKATPDTRTDGIARIIAIRTAEAWRPTAGEIRTGELISVRVGRDVGYGAYPVLVLENEENGIFAYHAFHTLDKEALGEIKPAKGDTITIFYGGVKETNASRNDFEAGKIEDKDRKYYHHTLIIKGDGSDLPDDDEYMF